MSWMIRVQKAELTPEDISMYQYRLARAAGDFWNTIWISPDGTQNNQACMGMFSIHQENWAKDHFALVYNGFALANQEWSVAGKFIGSSAHIPKMSESNIGTLWLKQLLTGPFRALVPFIYNPPNGDVWLNVGRRKGFIFHNMTEVNRDLFMTFCLAARCISEMPSIGLTWGLLCSAVTKYPGTEAEKQFFALHFLSVDGETFTRRISQHGCPLGWGGPQYASRWFSGDAIRGGHFRTVDNKKTFLDGPDGELTAFRTKRYTYAEGMAYLKGKMNAEAA